MSNSELSLVVESVRLPVAPDKVWNVVKDFNGWQAWHPAIAGTRITAGHGNAVGMVRELTTREGERFTEELLAYDAASRSYLYSIVDSPLPVVGYAATLQVRGDSGGSTVVWSSKFTLGAGASEAAVKRTIAGIYRAGLDRLASVVK
jgi:hypothetical protein